ncbi:MAG: hypothetical protein WCE62_17345, partial [Polyangiales bacterium]
GFVVLALLCLVGTACSSSAVGDPCVPEAVPVGGFLPTETYLEKSSVQCATRLCLVRELEGDPSNLQEDGCPGGTETCVTANDVERSVYCSCRCGAPPGSSGETCDCPGGFVCEEVLETGGEGLRGSYCVRDPLADVQSM